MCYLIFQKFSEVPKNTQDLKKFNSRNYDGDKQPFEKD